MELRIREVARLTAYELIEKNDLDFLAVKRRGVLGFKYTQKFLDRKYSFYAVENKEGKCLAIQVTQPLLNGIKLESIQKTKDAPHGIFKAVSDYFSSIYEYIVLDVYEEKLKKMYIEEGYLQINTSNCPSILAKRVRHDCILKQE